jgi:hypothetical protein
MFACERERRRTTVTTSLAALAGRAFPSEFDQGPSWWTSLKIAPTDAAIGVAS